MRGRARSPESSPRAVRINMDSGAAVVASGSPSRRLKSSAKTGTPSDRVSHISLRPKNQTTEAMDIPNVVHDSAVKPRAVYAYESSLNSATNKSSIALQHMDLHDSDVESFQGVQAYNWQRFKAATNSSVPEEDIVASSSVRRLNGGSLMSGNETQFQTAEIDEQEQVDNGQTGGSPNGRPPRILSRKFSPPPTPPKENADPIATPKRGRNISSTSLEFKTPSPPKGMPALPDPPSDEDIDSDKAPPPAKFPFTPIQNNRNMLNAKTPRPPGAWATPFSKPSPIRRAQSVEPVEKETSPSNDVIYTPPASYSRGSTSTIAKTPAPPGAWLATPGTTAAKRVQQRVRFDEKEIVASGLDPAPMNNSIVSEESHADGSVAIKSLGRPTQSPKSPRRIRVLDAFGNEIANAQVDNNVKPIEGLPFRGGSATAQEYAGSREDDTQGGMDIERTQARRRSKSSEASNEFRMPSGDAAVALHDLKGGDRRKDALSQLKASIAALKNECIEIDDISYVDFIFPCPINVTPR